MQLPEVFIHSLFSASLTLLILSSW
jgi:hypothetical protein